MPSSPSVRRGLDAASTRRRPDSDPRTEPPAHLPGPTPRSATASALLARRASEEPCAPPGWSDAPWRPPPRTPTHPRPDRELASLLSGGIRRALPTFLPIDRPQLWELHAAPRPPDRVGGAGAPGRGGAGPPAAGDAPGRREGRRAAGRAAGRGGRTWEQAGMPERRPGVGGAGPRGPRAFGGAPPTPGRRSGAAPGLACVCARGPAVDSPMPPPRPTRPRARPATRRPRRRTPTPWATPPPRSRGPAPS